MVHDAQNLVNVICERPPARFENGVWYFPALFFFFILFFWYHDIKRPDDDDFDDTAVRISAATPLCPTKS